MLAVAMGLPMAAEQGWLNIEFVVVLAGMMVA